MNRQEHNHRPQQARLPLGNGTPWEQLPQDVRNRCRALIVELLVDLARNDLSKHCRNVHVSDNKVIQYFSHVIHLVSKVEGHKPEEISSFQVFEDTFPAGTLSGAPKFMAIELINKYEPKERGFRKCRIMIQ